MALLTSLTDRLKNVLNGEGGEASPFGFLAKDFTFGNLMEDLLTYVDGISTTAGDLVADTIAELTAAAGVTVDGTLIKDGGATLKDSTTFIVDNADATKKIALQASGITTGNTRTITVPDEDINLKYVVRFLNVTLTEASFTAGAVSEAVNVGSALPTGSEVMWAGVNVNTEFSGGGAGSAAIEIGTAGDADAFMATLSVFTGSGTGRRAGARGVGAEGSGTQVKATLTSDVNVSALTAGSVDILVAYVPIGV